MKLDYKKYLKKLMPIYKFIKTYKFILGTLIVVSMFYFIVQRINAVTSVELNQDRYDQGILELDRITFDQEAIDVIKELQNRDVEVELDLPSNRDNPF